MHKQLVEEETRSGRDLGLVRFLDVTFTEILKVVFFGSKAAVWGKGPHSEERGRERRGGTVKMSDLSVRPETPTIKRRKSVWLWQCLRRVDGGDVRNWAHFKGWGVWSSLKCVKSLFSEGLFVSVVPEILKLPIFRSPLPTVNSPLLR